MGHSKQEQIMEVRKSQKSASTFSYTNGQEEDNDDYTDNEFQNYNDKKMSKHSHNLATITLCLCTLTHAWLAISVFPYSGFMAMKLIDHLNEENAGYYGGFLASSFMIGRACSSYAWGQVADKRGRKFVLTICLLLSCIFSLLFGTAQTFAYAITWRFLLGLSNGGIIGTVKTIVSELAQGDETLEAKSMGLVIGMWGWGFLVCPALSGAISEPVKQYPASNVVQMFEQPLNKYPFLLPNIVSVIMSLASLYCLLHWIPETLSKDQFKKLQCCYGTGCFDWCTQQFTWLFSNKNNNTGEQSMTLLPIHDDNNCKDIENMEAKPDRQSTEPTIQYSSISTFSDEEIDDNSSNDDDSEDGKGTLSAIWSRPVTRNHLTVYWAFSFCQIAVDEAFPLFCIAKVGGLGLPENAIGQILSGSGLLYSILQFAVYGYIIDKFGIFGSLRIGSWLSGPILCLVPLCLWLNEGSKTGTINTSTFSFLCIILSIYRIFFMVFASSVTVAINRSVLPQQRASINGLAMLGNSISKSIGPTFAGFLVAYSLSSGVFSPRVGAIVIFGVLALVGVIVAILTEVKLKY